MMKKRVLLTLIIAIAALAGLSAITIFKNKGSNIQLATVNPVFGSLSKTTTATGTLQPVDTVAVGAQVSGTIKNIYADFNSVVKKGQLLAELDPVVLRSQEQQVAANLQQARANFQLQTATCNRQQQLYNGSVISKAELEAATYQYRAAQDNVSSLQSQLKAAQKNVSFTRIYSPIDGTILSRNVSVGQTVAANFNTPVLFSIANDLTRMQVRASVDEADIGTVKDGQQASFTVDAYPDETFYGKVEEIRLEPTVSANVVTYTTVIEANNADLKLKPGMTANINILTQEQDNILLIPQSATQFMPDASLSKDYFIKPITTDDHQQKEATNNSHMKMGQHSLVGSHFANVWTERGDTLVEKQVETGLSNDVQVAVLKNLTRADVVVTGIDDRKPSGKKNIQERSPFMPATRGGSNRNAR